MDGRMRRMKYFATCLLCLLIVLPLWILYYSLSFSKIYCVVSINSSPPRLKEASPVQLSNLREKIAGYYSAFGGVYIRISSFESLDWSSSTDVFSILNGFSELLSQHHLISLGGPILQIIEDGKWCFFSPVERRPLFINQPSHPHLYISSPPRTGWRPTNLISNMSHGESYSLSIERVVGSLQDSSPLPRGPQSNIDEIFYRPSTYLLLTIIFLVAGYLFTYRVDPSAVSFSYSSIASKGAPYWRIITASFSHFDPLHLAFNTMSLYQLGSLEAVYGSVAYLYLSMAMVFITMLICAGIFHVQITRYGMTDAAHQHGVGYSCVLFAWMVAMSVRMKTFCPIFLLPSLCFPTYFLRLPDYLINLVGIGLDSALAVGIPFNVGPFILLVVTKVIMPQSSFIGHLSGIIIGYPLAWNMLHRLTPPVLLSILTALYIYKEGLLVWNIASFEQRNSVNIHEFVPVAQLRSYRMLYYPSIAIFVTLPVSVFLLGPLQLPARVMLVFILWSACQARRCEWILSGSPVNVSALNDVVSIFAVAGVFSYFMTLYDLCNVTAIAGTSDLLTVKFGLSRDRILLSRVALASFAALELTCLCGTIRCMWEMRSAGSLLAWSGLDFESLKQELKRCPFFPAETVIPFSGRAHRLADVTSNRVVII